MRRLAVVAALLVGHAVADEEAPAFRAVADAVRVAFAAGDDAALQALAAKDRPDPWLVVDELCFRGEHDAAGAFAAVRGGRLAAYAGSRRTVEPARERRDAVAAAGRAYDAKQPREALATLGPTPDKRADVTGIRAREVRGLALRDLNRHAESATVLEDAATAAERLGWLVAAQSLFAQAADSADMGGDMRRSARLLAAARRVARGRGDRLGEGTMAERLALAHLRFRDLATARRHIEAALAIAEELEHTWLEGMARRTLGQLLRQEGDTPAALREIRRAAEIFETTGDGFQHAVTLGALGLAHWRTGDLAQAIEHQELAIPVYRRLGDDRNLAICYINRGLAQYDLGDFPAARASYDEALSIAGKRGYVFLANVARSNLGFLLEGLGAFEESQACHARVLAYAVETKNHGLEATCHSGLGAAALHQGRYGQALGHYERGLELRRATGDDIEIGTVLGAIGAVYMRIGDHRRALALLTRSLAAEERHGNPRAIASVLGNLALTLEHLGDLDGAARTYERSLVVAHEGGIRHFQGNALQNLGSIHFAKGEWEQSLRLRQRALSLYRELGDSHGAALALCGVASSQARLGLHEPALRAAREALSEGERLASDQVVLAARYALIEAHRNAGNDADLIREARAAANAVATAVGGLGEEQGARARSEFGTIFTLGAAAAVRQRDAEALCLFLEQGRAGALLESLGGRAAVRQALPRAAQQELAQAEAALKVARWNWERARTGGDRKAARELRRTRDEARDALMGVIERIRREEKAAGGVADPGVDTLATIRARLRPGEALVLYGLVAERAAALVVDEAKARIVPLGATTTIEAATRLDLNDRTRDARASVASLRALVADPLALSADAKRVLISPDGALSYVPLGLLFDGRDVAFVPSATTYGVLRGRRGARGKDVLALGDPVYGRENRTLALTWGGRPLAPLPGSGVEARAVGDTVLLGAKATKAAIAVALARPDRWRAVHLACHGLVVPERPLLSALALTPTDRDDGCLTCGEVFRLRVQADLVVLSACETARGKVYSAEGVVGFTRAFMVAGAPRVIVSLWKVGDRATRALMVKFYELWNPADGAQGLPAATALKKAQRHVASQPRWKHPYYWAAWQLWGLAD